MNLEQIEQVLDYQFTSKDYKFFSCENRNDFSNRLNTIFRDEDDLRDYVTEEKLRKELDFSIILDLNPTFWINGRYISGLESKHKSPDKIVDLSGKGLKTYGNIEYDYGREAFVFKRNATGSLMSSIQSEISYSIILHSF